MRIRTLIAVVSLALAGVGPAGAAPTTLRCGDTVTGNVTLTRNLSCPYGPGLTLTGTVTLDLNGRTIAGQGVGAALTVAPLADVTISNGKIKNWGSGVTADVPGEQADIMISDVTLVDNATAIDIQFADLTVRDSRVLNSDVGIDGFTSSLDVDGVVFKNNGVGLFAGGSPTSLNGSTFIANTTGAYCSDTAFRVSRNTFRGNESAVITQMCGSVPLTDNTFRDNGTGYRSSWVQGQDQILRNTFSGNDIGVLAGAPTLVSANTFTRNDIGVTAYSDGWVVVTLDGNTFRRNGDGVYLEGTSFIANTTAVNNDRWGIYAPNATDMGGNVAYRNGEPPQCLGVVCSGDR